MRIYRVAERGGKSYVQRWRWWGWRWEDDNRFANPYAAHWMAHDDLDCYLMGVGP